MLLVQAIKVSHFRLALTVRTEIPIESVVVVEEQSVRVVYEDEDASFTWQVSVGLEMDAYVKPEGN